MAGLMQPNPGAQQPVPPPDPTQAPAAPAPAPDPSAAARQPGQQPGQQPSGPPLTDGPVDPDTYQKVVANCMTVVTQSLKQILASIASSQDKPGALATAAVHVLMRVEDSFEQSGGKLVLTMSFNAGAATLIDISEACEKAGVHQFGPKELDAAFLRAVDQYRVIRAHQGRIDQAQFQQQLQQMQQEANDGTLEQKFPGLNKFTEMNKPQQPGAASPAPDGDGPDSEAPGGDTEASPAAPAPDDGAAPAPAAAPKAKSNDFPAAMLKKREGKTAPKPTGKPKPKFMPKKGGK